MEILLPAQPVMVHRRWLLPGIAVVILVIAAVIRILCTFNDLWLDEVWSLDAARSLSSPGQVFTKIHHDNNHYLNTLWLYCCKQHENWPGFRAVSVAAGLGTVMIAGLIGRRRNPASAIIAMFLLAVSYVMILYSSEARGYALVVFFSFLSYYLLDVYLERLWWPAGLLFSLSAVMGILSHLTYLDFLFAALAWSVYRLNRSRPGVSCTIGSLVLCYAFPFALLGWLYLVDLKHLEIGHGRPSSLPAGLSASFTWALGLPSVAIFKIISGLVVLVVFGWAARQFRHKKPDTLLFFVGVVFVVPVILAVLSGSELFYVRYFIVGLAFILLLLSFALATLCQRSALGRTACLLVLAIYFVANCNHIVTLLKFGRGGYQEAVRLIATDTTDPVVTIGGDHHFRIGFVLEYYWREWREVRKAKFYSRDNWPAVGTEWLICHQESAGAPVASAPQTIHLTGIRYEMVKQFPSAPLSGMYWYVFRRQTGLAVQSPD